MQCTHLLFLHPSAGIGCKKNCLYEFALKIVLDGCYEIFHIILVYVFYVYAHKVKPDGYLLAEENFSDHNIKLINGWCTTSVIFIRSEWDAYQIKHLGLKILKRTVENTFGDIAAERLHARNFCLPAKDH